MSILRLTKNAAWLFSADMIARLSGALLSVAIIRHLHTSEYGAYSTILGFLLIGSLVAEFGLSQVLVREIAQNRTRATELFSRAVFITLLVAAIASAVSITAALLLDYPSTMTILLAISTIAIFTNVLILISGAVLRAFEQMGVLSLVNAVFSVSSAACGIVWLQKGAKLKELIVLLVATTVFNAVVLLLYILKRMVRYEMSSALLGKVELIKEAAPIAILGFCAVILQRFDVLLLSKTNGMSAVGIYSGAVTIVEALGVFIQSILGAAFPFIAVSWKESPPKALENYENILRYFVIVGLPVTVGLYLLSERVVLLLFRPEYMESAACLKILIWCFMLNSVAGPAGMFLIITKKKLRRFIPFAVTITGFSILLNLLFTPRYGYLAASVIALSVSMLLFVVKIFAIRDILPAQPRWIQISWRSFAGVLVMGGVLLWLNNYSLAELMVFGAISYGISLIVLGEFSNEYKSAVRYFKGSKA